MALSAASQEYGMQFQAFHESSIRTVNFRHSNAKYISNIEKRVMNYLQRLATLSLGIVIILIAPFLVYHLINDSRMRKTERSFADIDHPLGSRLVKRVRRVGLMTGNSSHCDFFVGELRTYEGDRNKLQNYYQHATVWSPITNTYQKSAVDIIFIENGSIPDIWKEYLPRPFRTAKDWSLPTDTKNQQFYIVFFFDVGAANSGCDFRCY